MNLHEVCGGIDIKESWKILWQKGIQIDVVHSTDNIKSIVIIKIPDNRV